MSRSARPESRLRGAAVGAAICEKPHPVGATLMSSSSERKPNKVASMPLRALHRRERFAETPGGRHVYVLPTKTTCIGCEQTARTRLAPPRASASVARTASPDPPARYPSAVAKTTGSIRNNRTITGAGLSMARARSAATGDLLTCGNYGPAKTTWGSS